MSLHKENTKSTKDRNMFAFENLYDDGMYYWFTAWSYNALFRMNKESWLVEYIGSFPNENLNSNRMFAQIIEYENKLYFTPSHAKFIGVYDKENKIFNSIDYSFFIGKNLNKQVEWNFYPACQYNGNLYFFPHQEEYILKVNATSGDITTISFINDELREGYIGTTWFFGIDVQGAIVYAPFNGLNAVLKLDMRNDKIEICKVGERGVGYADICFDGREFWLAPMHGREIVRWDNKRNTFSKMEISKVANNDYLFWGCAYIKNKVYFFPNSYNKALKVDICNSKEYSLNEFINICDNEKGIYYSNYIYCESDGCHLLYMDKNIYLSEINEENIMVRSEQLKLQPQNEDSYNMFISKVQEEAYTSAEKTNLESSVFPLTDFLKHVLKNDRN